MSLLTKRDMGRLLIFLRRRATSGWWSLHLARVKIVRCSLSRRDLRVMMIHWASHCPCKPDLSQLLLRLRYSSGLYIGVEVRPQDL